MKNGIWEEEEKDGEGGGRSLKRRTGTTSSESSTLLHKIFSLGDLGGVKHLYRGRLLVGHDLPTRLLQSMAAVP